MATRTEKRVGAGIAAAALVVATVSIVRSCSDTSPDFCQTDQTASLQSKFDGLDDGTELVLHGCYRVDGTLTLRDKHNVRLTGDNAALVRLTYASDRNASALVVQGGDHIEVSHLSVTGEKPNTVGYQTGTEGQHGIVVSGADYVSVDHDTIAQVRGDGIYVSGSTNVSIADNDITETGRHGIGVVSGDTIDVVRNTTSLTHRWSLDLEPNGLAFFVNNVSIFNNTFTTPTVGFLDGIGPQNNGTTCDSNPTDPAPPAAGDCHYNVTNVVAPHDPIGDTSPSDPSGNILSWDPIG